MIAACQAKLKTALIAAGVPELSIFTEAGKATGHHGVPWALLLTGPHKSESDGLVVAAFLNEAKTQKTTRRRTHRVSVQMMVALTATTEAAANTLLEAVIASVGLSWKDSANDWIRVDRALFGWLANHQRQQGASVQERTAEVVAGFEFTGGLYQNQVSPAVPDIHLTTSVAP